MTHYDTIGVHKKATDIEVRDAYNKLARKYHPDLNGNDLDKAAKMAEINVAYNVLKDTKRRRDYDKLLSLLHKPCSHCRGLGSISKQRGFAKRVPVPCEHCGGSGVAKG